MSSGKKVEDMAKPGANSLEQTRPVASQAILSTLVTSCPCTTGHVYPVVQGHVCCLRRRVT